MDTRRSVLSYGLLNEQLFERFPILMQPVYREMIGSILAGPYVVLGVLLNRYILDLVGTGDSEATQAVALFIEDMASAQDEGVTDLLTTEILPTLLAKQETLDSYWPLLGATTRRRLQTIHPRFARNVEVPARG